MKENKNIKKFEFLENPVAITEQSWPEHTVPLVSICCSTFNHENYIRDAIEGFLIQKTTFPVEILIHDDASTDNTAKIVREYEAKYPQLFNVIYQTENQWSKGGRPGVINGDRAKGKYVAFCEGDDYWIKPNKLQKQVLFLENNPDFGLVYSEIDRFYESTDIFEKQSFKTTLGVHPNTLEDFLINAWFLAPCTWVYRSELKKIDGKYVVGDFPLLLEICSKSKVFFYPEVTAVYRIRDVSASHFKSIRKSYLFKKGIFEIQLHYSRKFNLLDKTETIIRHNFYTKYYKKICLYESKEFVLEVINFFKNAEQYNFKRKVLCIFLRSFLFNPIRSCSFQ